MKLGSVKERKPSEARVGLIPSHVYEYIQQGHEVFVEKGLGLGSGFDDASYEEAGAIILDTAEEVWKKVDLMFKVKEPLKSEYAYLKEHQIIMGYFHLADNPELAQILLEKQITAIAYETLEDANGRLPLLKPMSEVAGRLAVQQGMKYLESTYGGKGLLLSGVPGVRRGHVLIIGGGEVGMSAAKAAIGTGASVTVLDRNLERLAYIETVFSGQVETLYSDESNLRKELAKADVVIGSVLIRGEKAPKLVRREHLALMEKGSVMVDVAIDQGGCFATSRMSTHEDPIYLVDGIVHYSVGNMPGAVPTTATIALANANFPYGLAIAGKGLDYLVNNIKGFEKAINTHAGHICNESVAQTLDLPYLEYKKIEKIMKV